MATLAGMDLGYGSQIKVVRTNYLCLNHIDSGTVTAQSLANVLQMYNTIQTQADADHLTCDYIITLADNAHGSGAAGASTLGSAPSGTSPTVVRSITTLPVLGPSFDHVAQVSGDGIVSGVNDSAANLGTSFSNKVLAVLNYGMVVFGGASFTTPTAIDLLGGVGGGAQLMMSELLCDGNSDTVDATQPMLDMIGTSGLGQARAKTTLDLTNANFNADFVQKGNAAGTTETTFGGVSATTVPANSCGVLSVVSLVKVA